MSVSRRLAGLARAAAVCVLSIGSLQAIGQTQTQPANASFETPAYGATGRNASPAGASWAFAGTAGIERLNSAFGAAVGGYNGQQVAYLSSAGSVATLGSVAQNVNFPQSGQYYLRFQAGRLGADNAFKITIAGAQVDSYIKPRAIGGAGSPHLDAWWTVPFTISTPGMYEVKFQATDIAATLAAGDVLLLDQVVVAYATGAFPNGSFEGGAGWTLSGYAAIDAGGPSGISGNNALRLRFGSYGGAAQSAPVSIAAGRYSVSARLAKSGGGDGCTQYISYVYNGTSYTAVGLPPPDEPDFVPYTSNSFNLPGGTYYFYLSETCGGNWATTLIDALVLNRAGPDFANASFETPDIGPPANDSSTPRLNNPSGASWAFTGLVSRIQGNSGAYVYYEPRTTSGKQFADIGISSGAVTQTLTMDQGTYVLVPRLSDGWARASVNGQLSDTMRGTTQMNSTGNGELFAEVISDPFSIANTAVFDVGFASGGNYGFSLDLPRLIQVSGNLPPVVTFPAPAIASGKTYAVAQGPTASGLSVTVTATDVDGLQANSVKLFNNGTQVGSASSTSPLTVSLPSLSTGTYTLTAAATDTPGMTGTASRTLKVNNPPQGGYTVQNGGPHQLEPGATVNVIVSAAPSDTDGAITTVEYLLDGALVSGCTRTAAPWSPCTITLSPRAANYVVTARATDDDGGVTTYATTTVTVNAKPVITALSLWQGASQMPSAPSGPNNYVVSGSQAAGALVMKVTANDLADAGAVATYSFQKDGVDIAGCVAIATAQCSLPALAPRGTSYSFTVTAVDNRSGSRVSTALLITVNTAGGTGLSSTMNLTVTSAALTGVAAPTRTLSVNFSRSSSCTSETFRVMLNGILRYEGAYATSLPLDIVSPGAYWVDAIVICTAPTADSAISNHFRVTPDVDASAFTETVADVENLSAPNATGGGIAGTLPGSASVNPSGAVTYSIPVSAPPGTAGMQPSLALSYSSQAGRGILGTGWSLSGFSTIHRCPASVVIDGFKGTVSFGADDRFCLDGMRLIAIGTGLDGVVNTEYRTERDSYSRIFSRWDSARGRVYWTVETKSGQTLVFNEPLFKANIDGSGWNSTLIKAWGISRTQDTAGNYMTFNYTMDHARGWLLPLAVNYTGHTASFGTDLSIDPTPTVATYARVELGYDMASRPDSSVLYDGTGSYGEVPPIVSRITSTVDGAIAQQLNLSYESSATTGRARLTSIQACGGGGNATTGLCLQPTTFAYNNAAVSSSAPWTEIGDIGFDVNLFNGRGLMPLDLNGTGKTQVLQSDTFSNLLYSMAGGVTLQFTNAGAAAGYNVASSRCVINNAQPCAQDANSAPVLGDFNGDGFTDFVFTIEILAGGTPQSRFVVCLAAPPNPTQMQCEIKFDWGSHNGFVDLYTPYGQGLSHAAVPSFLVGDFDGDGKSDVLILGANGSLFYNYAPMAAGPSARRAAAVTVNDVEKVSVGDFDGDGRLDVAELVTSQSSGYSTWVTWLSRAKPSDAASVAAPFIGPTYAAGPRKRSYQPHIADTNGDGLADLLGFDGNPEMWVSNGVPPTYGVEPYLGQFRWHGCLSRGNGTFDCTVWRGPPSGEFDFAGKKMPLEILGDFNGDGRSDLAIYDSDYSADNPGSAGRWWICVARPVAPPSSERGAFDCGPTITGSQLQGGGVWSNGLRRKGRTQTNPNQYGYDSVVSGDFVGDGRSGLAGGTPVSGHPRITRLNVVDATANIPDMLASVTNGLGFTSNFTYKPITDATIYTKAADGAYPALDIQTAMYVATEVKHDDGLNTGGKIRYTYKYEGLKAHSAGGGTLGFKKIIIRDEQSGITTESTYDNTYPARGLALITEKKKGAVLLNHSETAYQLVRPYGAAGTVLGSIHAFLPVVAIEQSFELDGLSAMPKTRTETQYGDPADPVTAAVNQKFGCATSVISKTYGTDGTTVEFQKSAVNGYDNAESNWRLCRLRTATVTSTQTVYADLPAPAGNGASFAAETRSSDFDYDATTGMLKQERLQTGGAQEIALTTDYLYDSFGNRQQATVTGWAGPTLGSQTRISRTFYDARGRFPTSSENALGQTEQRTYNATLGVMESLTGPNALTTTYKYDKLGRTVTEIRADGSKTAMSYAASSAGGITLTTRVTGGGESSVDSDRLGREVRKSVKLSDNGSIRWTNVDTVYDARGRLSKTSRPYYAIGGSVIYPLSRDYDDLDRVWREILTNDDGTMTTTQTTFAGLTTTVSVTALTTLGVNSTRTASTVRDGRGTTRTVTNTAGNTVEHAYDAAGNLRRTVRAVGGDKMVTGLTYDLRGRKLSLSDPDAGTFAYGYNAFGELISQIDGRAQTTQSEYDKLGRLKIRSSADLISRYVYDSLPDGSCVKAIGKLCRVSSEGSASPSTSSAVGYQRDIRYDPVGRFSTETTLIATSSAGVTFAARSYVAATAYDAAGRIRTITYPNGEFATRQYDASGVWNKLLAGGGKVLWQGGNVDADAHWLNWSLGNGLSTSASFGVNTARLLGLTGNHPVNGDAQRLELTYDGFGNIKSRRDVPNNYRVGAGAETFEYDSLNQLTKANFLEGTQIVTYDGFGRIVTKSNVAGTYQYRGSPVTNGSTTSNRIQSADGRNYTYDDSGSNPGNGNVVRISNTASTANMTGTPGEIAISWTSFNQPSALPVAAAQNAGASASGSVNSAINLLYGPDYERRVEQLPTDNTVTGANQVATRFNLHAGASLFYEEDVRWTDNSREQRAYFLGPLGVVAVHATNTDSNGNPVVPAGLNANSQNNSGTPFTLTYWHRDHLGSSSVTTDEFGAVKEQMRFDPWGKPMTPLGSRARTGDRGFTGHEHLAGGLIHMNGRIYDPVLGRFLSTDLFVQFPDAITSYNRYAYVMNNPLGYTDPSGYFIPILIAALVEAGVAKAVATVMVYAATASAASGVVAMATGHTTGARRFFAAAVLIITAGTPAGGLGAMAAGGLQSGSAEGAIVAGISYAAGAILGPILVEAVTSAVSAASNAIQTQSLAYTINSNGYLAYSDGTLVNIAAGPRTSITIGEYFRGESVIDGQLYRNFTGVAVSAEGVEQLLIRSEKFSPAASFMGSFFAASSIGIGGPIRGAAYLTSAVTAERLLAASAGARLASESGMLRLAATAKGNFGLGSASVAEANELGRAWVGEGARLAQDGRTLVSSDKLRTYRPPSPKNSPWATTGTQANFERLEVIRGRPRPIANGHLDILP